MTSAFKMNTRWETEAPSDFLSKTKANSSSLATLSVDAALSVSVQASTKVDTKVKANSSSPATLSVDAALNASVQASTKADTKVRSWKGTAGPSSAIGALLGAIHACATAIAIIVIVWRGIQSLSNPQSQHFDSAVEGRSALLDNTKWIAQLLVVFNHVLYYLLVTPDKDMEPWLHGAKPLIRRIGVLNNYLVNPLFCFISGVVSQGQPTTRRISRLVQYLIIPTFLYNVVVFDFLAFLKQPGLETLTAIPGKLTPSTQLWGIMNDPLMLHAPWYLISLCVWRSSVYILWSHLPKPVAFAGMCIVSCVGGYVPLPNGGFHGLNATVAYLPHFGLGYIFPFHEVARRIQKPRMAVSAFIVLLLWIIAAIIQWLLPKGTFPDGHGWYGCCGQNINLKFWWLRRLSKVVLEISAVLPVVFLVVPRNRLPLTHVGNHTLYSYLFHGVAFEWRKQLWSMYPPPQLNSAVMHCMIICFYYVPWSLVTLLMFTSPVWRSLWGWALTPTWLDKYFATLEKHAAAFWPRGHTDTKDSSDKKPGTDEPDKQEVAKNAMMQDAAEKAEDKPVADKTAGSMDNSH